MYELKLQGVPLPRCMVVEDRREALLARESGWPYIIRPRGWDDRKLVGAIMYHFLEKKFPFINWREALGIRKAKVDRMVVSIPDHITERVTDRDYEPPEALESMDGETDLAIVHDGYIVGTDKDPHAAQPVLRDVDMTMFFQDAVEYVNMEHLQQLGLLPKFLGDIIAAIKYNLSSTAWMDGYNKKLGTTVGEFKYGEDAPNLIILDTSASIPRGLAYTMITLIDMLRTQANADLIITSRYSEYFSRDEELPEPEKLSYLVGGCNEASQFNHILEDKIFGRHWGNVICFGDMHAPCDLRFRDDYQVHDDRRRNTQVDRIMCYDTRGKMMPGYVKWAEPHAGTIEYDDGGWCRYFRERVW